MVSYEYKLYRSKKNRFLDDMLMECSFVWNHALALQKRYYRMYGGYITSARMQKHFVKRIHRRRLHSQTRQEIIQRLDSAYQRFFKRKAKRPPKFKKVVYFTSFVFKQGGFKIEGNRITLNRNKKTFKFSLSRPYEGNVKQVRIKRNKLGEYFLYVVTDHVQTESRVKTHDGAVVGIDFGLRHYLTTSDGETLDNPQYLKRNIRRVSTLSKRHSKKAKGSNNREKARKDLARMYRRVHNLREDYQWKLAHELCRRYDFIFIEDLNLTGMIKLWGRKMNDLAHGAFVAKLMQVADKYGVTVHKIDRFYPSSRMCACGYKNDRLTLNDRNWTCPQCGVTHDRDVNAAENILRRGIYELERGSKTDEPCGESATPSIQESHAL